MGFSKKAAFFLFMMMAVFGMSMGSVYKVGDSSGWTDIGRVDYKTWSATKNFHVGDTILFEYNNQFHNVTRVTHKNYNACNGTAPYAAFISGNDSFTIKKGGHFYFICGFPGHCQAGQKVDIRVPRTSHFIPTPALAPAPALSLSSDSSPSPAPHNQNPAPAPAQSSSPNPSLSSNPSPAPHSPNLAPAPTPSWSPSPAPRNPNLSPAPTPSWSASPAPHNPNQALAPAPAPSWSPSPAPHNSNPATSSSPNPAPKEQLPLPPPSPSPSPSPESSAADIVPAPHNSASYVHISKGLLPSNLCLSMVLVGFGFLGMFH